MADLRYPNEVFRFANVRAPQKHLEADYPSRYVDYSFVDQDILDDFDLLYETLVTHRTEPDSRTVMRADCVTYQSDDNYILSVADLYSSDWYKGFKNIDDYLRTKQKLADKAELIGVIEDNIGASINTYITDSAYLPKKLNLWDNLFAQIILANNSPLRTEILRVIRLLKLMERLNAGDSVLDTGDGIYQGYLATVILPEKVFPLEDIINDEAEDPVTSDPTSDPDVDVAIETLSNLRLAYDDIKQVYNRQNYNYRSLKSRPANPDEETPELINHNEHIISPEISPGLKDVTKEILETKSIPLDFIYVPQVLAELSADMKAKVNIIETAKPTQYAVRVGTGLISISDECSVYSTEPPCNPFTGAQIAKGSGNIKPIGIADLKVVQSQLLKYELGEVAHIENILAGETKKRTFRNFNRSEQTLLEESEFSSETEKETQTTERFELHTEAAKVIQEDQQTESQNQKESSIGASVSASYGSVTSSFNASFGSSSSNTSASSTSQVVSNRNATDYAKSIMSRALSRVIQKTRTQKTTTTIIEFEDTTEHGVDNTTSESPDNIAGVYRWVDKYYYNKVINYGKRLMFEFIIPEPAAFYIYSRLQAAKGNVGDTAIPLPEPVDLKSFNEITPENYDIYSARYGATDVAPPPSDSIIISATKAPETSSGDGWYTWQELLDVPQGYQAEFAKVNFLLSTGEDAFGNEFYISVYIDDQLFVSSDWASTKILPLNLIGSSSNKESVTGRIPIIARIHSGDYAISVEITCVPTQSATTKWKIETYNKILAAYKQRKREYDQWVASQGIIIQGNNPNINRIIEKTELKKHSIEMISGQRFEAFDALKPNVPDYGYPEFSFSAAIAQGTYIQFFEQAFEWEQMTYMFYPYFWARKREWVNILKRDDNDPLFMAFLQAGACRVLVPVRPAYTKAILYYLSSGGEIWNGEDVPSPTDPLYVSIIDEMKEFDGQFTGGNQEGEPWIQKVPTNLVYLTKLDGSSPGLPDFSGELLP